MNLNFISYLLSLLVGIVMAGNQPSEYVVPKAIVKVLKPKGFEVSIPHSDGITLFAFHGNLNRELNGIEAGQFSQDVLDKNSSCSIDSSNGCWTYVNRNQKVNDLDQLHYWTYVIKDGLGFLRMKQQFTHNDYASNTSFKPEISSDGALTTEKIPPLLSPSFTCPQSFLSHLTTCLDILAETREHFNKTRQQLAVLLQTKKVELEVPHIDPAANEKSFSFSSIYSHAIVLEGNIPSVIPSKENYLNFVNFLLWEVLELIDLEAVNANRDSTGLIIFNLRSAADKQRVLTRAKSRLTNSTIIIRDVTNSK